MRENGGQYTHAALWTVMALARLGRGDEAMELFHMLNPINHARTAEGVERYQVEPYVVAADVYAHPMHVGRGGWTWYTGSAGWMYQAAITRTARPAAPRRHLHRASLHSGDVAGVFDRLEVRRQPIPDRSSESGTPVQRRSRRVAGRHTGGFGQAIPLGDDPGTHAVVIVMGAASMPPPSTAGAGDPRTRAV